MTTARSLLAPESRLALLPSRSRHRVPEFAGLLSGPLDWHKLLAFADRERCVLPLWRAARETEQKLDGQGARVLKHMARVWEFRLIHLERLLFETLGTLAESGIEVTLLKGAAAALTVYDGFSQRPMVDVDVLVPHADARDAWTLARGLGWRWDARAYPFDAYERAHHLPPLNDAFGGGVAFEIHVEPLMPDHPFRLSGEDIREEVLTIDAGAHTVRVPRIDHQLLHCCIHFAWSHRLASHAWRAFSDVDAFVASGRLDWDYFTRVARDVGAETCCYWTLRLSRTLAGVHVPDEVLQRLSPAGPSFVLRLLERHFLLNVLPDESRCPSIRLQRRLWELGIQRGRGSGGIRLPSAPRPKSVPERISHHVRSLRLWLKYLGRLA